MEGTAKVAVATTYVVLQEVGSEYLPGADVDVTSFNGPTWRPVATIDARSPETAIRSHIESLDESRSGTFVAIPSRSWRPTVVKVETKRVVTVDAAK